MSYTRSQQLFCNATYIELTFHYGAQCKGGYPLGSGGIESANKFICHARLNRLGAWWYVANSNHTLALRCAKYNGTFEHVFDRYKQTMLVKFQQKNVKK